MSDLNQTPAANRLHIAFFGRRNAGKSSLVNALTGQELSIVSPVKGTTTDPVWKAMELLPLGPVVIIDTPGFDDEGSVGEQRVKKVRQILKKTDLAVLVIAADEGKTEEDRQLMGLLRQKKIPFLLVYNKCDICRPAAQEADELLVSAMEKINIQELKEKIAALALPVKTPRRILGDQLAERALVILVTPIDRSAPQGRMILPQVQTIRDILDSHALCFVVQSDELPAALDALKEPPALVITDSQAFHEVKDKVPESVPLSSFSILFARYKGILQTAVKGALHVGNLQDDDQLLICEGCTHHRQCEDIGSVKLPNWIQKFSGKRLRFAFTSGGDFPEDLRDYALIVHCGACMLNEREVLSRQMAAEEQAVPFTNYGTLIAHMNGILRRSLQPFPEMMEAFDPVHDKF